MQGPLSPDIYDTSRQPDSWWRASCPEWQQPAPLTGDKACDVAIIGGGYAGLSTSIRLAELGINPCVLDAAPIGWGASGRNGGIVGIESHKLSHKALIRRCGADEVARYQAAQLAGVDRLSAFCTAHAVPMQGTGEVLLAHSAKAHRALLADAPPEGVVHEPIAPTGTSDMSRFGGIRIRPGFGVHPLRLVRALADHAHGLGVAIHPNSEVLSWTRNGTAHLLQTRHATLHAGAVVVATNGFMPDGLHKGLDGLAVPVISNIAVTRVLTAEERARHAWLSDDPVADTRNLLVYLRMLPEGRLLFGMRGDLTGAHANAPAMQRAVSRRLARCFPGWSGIEIDYFWRGPICATASYTPAVGQLSEDRTVFHAFGWHGSGVNGAQVAGRLLADVVAGAPLDRIPLPFRGAAPRLPFPRLRPAYVGAALVQQRLADLLS